MGRTGAALAFAAILAAAAHGEVSCPTADAEGGLSGVVTFHNVSEPYFFIEDDSGAAWRIECEDAKSCSFAKRGARVAARGVFPKWATLRLSRDLHDGFQQLLAGTMFRLEAAMNLLPEDAVKAREQLEKASDALYHTQTGLRAALWSMTEESEGPNNLSGLVKYAAGRLAHWQGVVHFEFRGEERHVPPSLSGEVLMGLQEAVGNALRHGGATDVKVAFSFRRDELVISIRDNGCGFDVAAAYEGSGHLGLRSMRERAGRLGGTMTIKSEVGAGTIVVVRLPYGERQQHDQRTHS